MVMIPQKLCCTLWFSPAILSLKELLVHNQLSLITKTPLRGLDDSHIGVGIVLQLQNILANLHN
jgi:hypothetical protein